MKLIRSNGEQIPQEIADKLSALAFDIYEGDNYEEQKDAYNGSIGNFFAKK